MKFSLTTKLLLSYIAIILLTLFLVSYFTDLQIEQHIASFYEKLRDSGFTPPEGMLKPNDEFIQTVQNAISYTALAAALGAIVFSYLSIRYLTRPIHRLIRATKEIAHGNYQARVPVENEDELGELTDSLNTMAASLENHRHLQKELIVSVAHELATPLTSISGYLEALTDNVIEGETRRTETLKLMQEEARRLEAMLKEVRTLAAAEEPHYKIEKTLQAPKAITGRILKQMAPQFRAKKVALKLDSPRTLPRVLLDKNRYTQILLNLLTNALKYSQAKQTVTVSIITDGVFFTLTVADQGEGIPPKDLPCIFERFYRVDASRSRHTGGLGIGLAIVKELVEAHGGTITAQSTLGKGSTFTLKFRM